MTRAVPDFDVEKRRRWYAAVMGTVSALLIMIITFIKELTGSGGFWGILFLWVLLTVCISLAAYMLWYKPYSNRFRAIVVSTLAVILGFFLVFVILALSDGYELKYGIPVYLFSHFLAINVGFFGVQFIAPVIIGWLFARKPSDERDSF